MSDDYDLWRAQHGQRAFQLERLIQPGLDECFDLFFAEGSQHASAKTARKTFGSGKADAIALITAAVQDLDAFSGHHFDQLLFLAAFIVMVAQHCNNGNTQPHQAIEQGVHLLWLAVIGKVAGNHQQIGFVAHARQRIAKAVIALGSEMNVCCCRDSHKLNKRSTGAAIFQAALSVFPWITSALFLCSARMSRLPHSATSMANILSSIRLPRNSTSLFGCASSTLKRCNS